MFQKIIHFIKYHNAFTIIFMIVFVGFGAVFAANPEARDIFISSEEIVRSIDNSGVVSADLDNFDFMLQIKEITEDQNNYYIIWSYKTMAISDYIWQEIQKENTLTVSKEVLGERDLGLYAAKELGEVIDHELSYLKEVQQIENKKGLTQKVATVEYSGLIGRFLDPKEKIFPGYELVVQPPEPSPSISVQEKLEPQEIVQEQEIVKKIEKPVDEELIRQIVLEMLSQQREQATSTSASIATSTSETASTSTPSASEPETPVPVCDANRLDLCLTETGCQGAAGFWYNEQCNSEPEQVCSAEHLDLCTTQELCEGVSLHWYDDVCNLEPAPESVSEPASEE